MTQRGVRGRLGSGTIVVVLASLLAMILAGCSTFPRAVTCGDIGAFAVNNPAEPIRLRNFSLIPPNGPHWCYDLLEGFGVVFYKNLYGGRILEAAPSVEERAHTFVAFAYVAHLDGESISNETDLASFVETWLQNGMPEAVISQGMATLSSRPCAGTDCTRLAVIQSNVTVDRSHEATCVRYGGVFEQVNNPRAPGDILVLEVAGSYACLHPYWTNKIVMIEYSERFIKERRPGPSLSRALERELEPYVSGVRFLSPY
jgi:hypothetical protein